MSPSQIGNYIYFKKYFPPSNFSQGLVTSIYSIGGLITASFTGTFAGRYGRRPTTLLTTLPFFLGSLLLTTAHGQFQLQLGRFLAGLGAGAAIVVVPLYLNEIAPEGYKGLLGFMNQVSINVGILLAQMLGVAFGGYDGWRKILGAGMVIAFLDAILLWVFVPESPKWVQSQAQFNGGYVNEDQSLLPGAANVATTGSQVSILEFCTVPDHRSKFVAVSGVMAFQQLCGINSIIFYGVSVLAVLFPQLTTLLNCLISLLNCVVTVASSTIVDHYGRKPLLLGSITGMAVCAFGLGLAIVHSWGFVAASAAMGFVVAFAMGLGPIPFMIVPELVPNRMVGAAQSVGTTVNWLATFIVGFLFPVLQTWMGGKVYYLFAGIGIGVSVFNI